MALGEELYARRFWPRTTVAEIKAVYGGLQTGEDAENSDSRVAGRVISRREHGKAAFLTIRDGWDDIQLYANINTLGEELFRAFTHLDLGDIIGVEGHIFRTRRGELSVFVQKCTLLTKSVRPLPEKFHGLQDRETRYRQRYADLISNPEVSPQLLLRSRLIAAMRR